MSGKRDASEADLSFPGAEWEKRWSKSNSRHYWYNTVTQKTTWEVPSDGSAAEEPRKVRILEEKGSGESRKVAWKKAFSAKYNRDYWYNEETGERSWEDPANLPAATFQPESIKVQQTAPIPNSEDTKKELFQLTKLVLTSPEAIAAELERERRAVAVDASSCPREIATANLSHIVHRLRTESVPVVQDPNPKAEHPILFRLPDDDTAMITRAVQEDQILKTRLKAQAGERAIDLPSFWDVWEREEGLRRAIIEAADPNEAKWQCQKTFNYKLATTFMPAYAKALYEHFQARSVLDPCAGWGDRLVGAAACSTVERYVCFDPNTCLRPGYAQLMQLFGHEVTQLSAQSLKFSNGFEQHALPFEVGAPLLLADESFDLVFTSPPFFDYEQYNPNNPQYVDWIAQFYTPLFTEACRCLKPGHHFAIHVGDTSAGLIGEFLKTQVRRICALKLVSRIGLHGMMSGKTRSVWIYKKMLS